MERQDFYNTFVKNVDPLESYQLIPGTMLAGRYLIGTALGAGGFGITYRAYDTLLSASVAIKEYYPGGLVSRYPGHTEISVYSGDRSQQFSYGKDKFMEEARSLAKFSSHANIVNVLDFMEENGTAYIVMEFLEGVTLKEVLKNNKKPMELEEAFTIILPIIDALKTLHSQGLIHRDVSPDNIFLKKDGGVKLIDFGAARFSLGEKESTLSIILKPGYAPPEQYRSKSRQGPFSDVYAMGGCLYRMLTGVAPEESLGRVLDDAQKKAYEINPKVSKNISDILDKAMSVSIDGRYQTMAEFESAILGLDISTVTYEAERQSKKTEPSKRYYEPINANSSTKIKKTPKTPKKKNIKALWIGGATVALILLLSLAYFMNEPLEEDNKENSGGGSKISLGDNKNNEDNSEDVPVLANYTFDYVIVEQATGENKGCRLLSYKGDEKKLTLPSNINGQPVVAIGKKFSIPKDVEEIIMPDTIIEIGELAFVGLEKLKSIKLSQSIVSIRQRAFAGCLSLEELDIPDTTQYIGYGAFSNCKSLTKVRCENAEFNSVFYPNEKQATIYTSLNSTTYESLINEINESEKLNYNTNVSEFYE